MSGGCFEYNQYYIDDIADKIEDVLKDLDKPRPPMIKKRIFALRRRKGNQYTIEYFPWDKLLENCNSIEEAERRLNSCESIRIYKNGKIYDLNDLWVDKDGKKRYAELDVIMREYDVYDQDKDQDEENFYCGEDYTEETIKEFKKAVKVLRQAAIYAQRIDWLLSGDDGEESFHKRLQKELQELENKPKQ